MNITQQGRVGRREKKAGWGDGARQAVVETRSTSGNSRDRRDAISPLRYSQPTIGKAICLALRGHSTISRNVY